MSTITVNTRLGTGGKWITIASYTAGPRNLIKASKELFAEIQSNRGVGGYHSNLEIDGHVIGQENIGWDLDTAAAKRVIADPEAYAPVEFDAEWVK